MAATTLPRVVLLESIHRDGIEILGAHTDLIQLSGPQDPLRAEALRNAVAIVVRSTPVTAELMDEAPGLRVIGRHGAGTDNIDRAAADARGILIVNTPRSNTESVAEYVITVALLMLKRIDEVSLALRSGAFTPARGSLPGQVDRAGLVGREISGLRLGLVGAGAIGRAVASRASALGMSVRAYDPFVDEGTLAELGIGYCSSLDEVLVGSDIVSLHTPGGGSNRALVGAEEIARMPADSYLINAARGDLVDSIALAAALASGHLAGAAVDVFELEPPAPSNPLLAAPRLIATPHMAAMTREALRRMAVDVARGTVDALTRP